MQSNMAAHVFMALKSGERKSLILISSDKCRRNKKNLQKNTRNLKEFWKGSHIESFYHI